MFFIYCLCKGLATFSLLMSKSTYYDSSFIGGVPLESHFYSCNSFNVTRKKLIHTTMPSRHYHDAYEILYLVSGELYYFIGEKTYQVVGGVLLFINMNDVHKLVNSSQTTFERITLLFKKEFLNDFFNPERVAEQLSFFELDFHVIRLAGNEQNYIEDLFHRMIHEGMQEQAGFEQYQKILLMELLLFINRKVRDRCNDRLAGSNQTHKKIFEIVNYMNSHYYQRLSLDELSKQFHISSSYLSRTFKDTTGFTVIEYLNNIRIKEARALLKESSYKVLEISEKVGFDSLTHFGRTFKHITGFSPLKYRRLQFK